MDYVSSEVGETPPGSEKSMRVYYDECGNKLIRKEGSRSWRNNNPGNLIYNKFTRENGAIGTDGTFAIFADLDTGQRVRKKLLKGSKYHHLTLEQMAYKYEPESKEKSEAYCRCIVSRSKLDRTRILNSFSDEEFDRLLQAMQQCEGWKVGDEEFFPIQKIIGVRRGKSRSFELFNIEGIGWVTKNEAIAIAETKNLSVIIVHLKNGHKYLRSKRSDPAFQELIC